MSAPREKFSKVMVWPAMLLALAAALYAAGWSVQMYYALMPARFAFELRAGAEHAAEFRARLDTTYIERDLYMSRCLLGDPDVPRGIARARRLCSISPGPSRPTERSSPAAIPAFACTVSSGVSARPRRA